MQARSVVPLGATVFLLAEDSLSDTVRPRLEQHGAHLPLGTDTITALEWQVGRQAQDELAVASHRNLAAAYDRGFLDDLVQPYLGLERDQNLRPDSSVEKLGKLFISPGPIYDAEGRGNDWWRTARGLFAAGFRAGDRVMNTFAYHFTPAGSMFESGAHALGCAVFPAGTGNTELQVEAIAAVRPRGRKDPPARQLERDDE